MSKIMEIRENYIDVTNRQKMFYRYCIPEKPKGAVMVIHGYTEHSGRYTEVLNYFAMQGFAVAAPDILGHGRSTKKLGDIKSYRSAVEAIAALILNLQDDYNLPRFFVIGHSMGAGMTLALAGLYPGIVKGIIVIAAMILVPDYVSPVLRSISKILAALFPTLPVQNINLKEATQNEEIREAARQDPLYYRGKIRARTGIQLLEGIDLARSMLKNITAPSLILHGSNDKIMPVEGSEIVMKEIGSKDKIHKVYDGWYHELLSEPDRMQLLQYIATWIDERNK